MRSSCVSWSSSSRGSPQLQVGEALLMGVLVFSMRRSRLSQRDVAGQVVVFVTELVVDHDQALGVVGQWQFPGHADAAMQLDAFFGHLDADAADADLGGRQGPLARDGVLR